MPLAPTAADQNWQTLQALTTVLSRYGNREALLTFHDSAPETWTYKQLGERAERLAQGLAAAGLSTGGRVVLLAGNSPEWIVACLAVLRAGGVVVPLDAQLGDDVLGHILDDSAARMVFTTHTQAERLGQLPLARPPRLIFLDSEPEDETGWRRLLDGESAALPTVGPDDEAAVFYTSGTTGTPKGVPLTHRNIAFQIHTLEAAQIVSASDRVLLPLPLHHVYPLVVGLLTGLALGLPLLLPRGLTGPELVDTMRRGRATLIIGVPRLYSALISGIEARLKSRGALVGSIMGALLRASIALRQRVGLRAGRLLLWPLHRQIGPDLRVLVSGGSALKPEFGLTLEGLGWRVATGYGLTETAPMLTIDKPGTARLDTAGKPIPGVDLRIDTSITPEGGEGTPLMENGHRLGEIQAKGPNVFHGYLDQPEETAEAFTPDGWFRTGDLGYFDDDGWLHIVGRVSTLIVTEGGKNVQPEEVEDAYQQHASIGEIAVLQRRGRLVGLIVPDAAEIRRHGGDVARLLRDAVRDVSRGLPSYRRLSDFAITREPIPRTRLGKPRRHLLLERYEQALRGEERPSQVAGLMPETEMGPEDRRLLESVAGRAVWQWLGARYPDQRITPDTSLQLDLGVDSMEWLNLTLEIGQQAQVELREDAIAEIDTVRDLLSAVVAAEEAGQVPLEGGVPEHPEAMLTEEQKHWLKPLTSAQVWLARLLLLVDRIAMRGLFRLEVEGLDHLPAQGPYILAPTHASFLDPFALGAGLDFRTLRRTYWAGWTGISFRNRLFRFFSRITQVIPVDAQRALVSSLAFAGAVLRRGNALVWFPEGGRSQTGAFTTVKPGIGLLVERYRVPVVPVVIEGTHEAWPVGERLPRLHPIRVRVHAPLEAAVLEREGEGESAQERIVSSLQAHFLQLLEERHPAKAAA